MVRKAVACFRPEAQVEDRLEDRGQRKLTQPKGPDPDETTLRPCAPYLWKQVTFPPSETNRK